MMLHFDNRGGNDGKTKAAFHSTSDCRLVPERFTIETILSTDFCFSSPAKFLALNIIKLANQPLLPIYC